MHANALHYISASASHAGSGAGTITQQQQSTQVVEAMPSKPGLTCYILSIPFVQFSSILPRLAPSEAIGSGVLAATMM